MLTLSAVEPQTRPSCTDVLLGLTRSLENDVRAVRHAIALVFVPAPEGFKVCDRSYLETASFRANRKMYVQLRSVSAGRPSNYSLFLKKFTLLPSTRLAKDLREERWGRGVPGLGSLWKRSLRNRAG